MNFYDHTIRYTLAAVAVIYTMGYFLSWFLSEQNRRTYWLWLKNIVRKQEKE